MLCWVKNIWFGQSSDCLFDLMDICALWVDIFGLIGTIITMKFGRDLRYKDTLVYDRNGVV